MLIADFLINWLSLMQIFAVDSALVSFTSSLLIYLLLTVPIFIEILQMENRDIILKGANLDQNLILFINLRLP